MEVLRPAARIAAYAYVGLVCADYGWEEAFLSTALLCTAICAIAVEYLFPTSKVPVIESWTGRRVVITGGAGGLGSELAKLLLSQGAVVGCWDVDAARLSALAAAAADIGGTLHTAAVDITNEDAVRLALSEFGEVDVLFCNAGVVACKRFLDMTEGDFQKTLAVNVAGALSCIAIFDSAIASSDVGRVCVISSAVAGVGSVAGLSEYCGSKWGLSAAVEDLKHLKRYPLITVSPSFMTTQMFDGVTFNLMQRLITPPLDPKDVAAEAVHATATNRSQLFLPSIFSIARIVALLLPASLVDTMSHAFGVHTAANPLLCR